jgi:hypothetical protein
VTLRDLIARLEEHAEGWPMNLDRDILIRVGHEVRDVETTYVDTGFVLVAGRVVYPS